MPLTHDEQELFDMLNRREEEIDWLTEGYIAATGTSFPYDEVRLMIEAFFDGRTVHTDGLLPHPAKVLGDRNRGIRIH